MKKFPIYLSSLLSLAVLNPFQQVEANSKNSCVFLPYNKSSIIFGITGIYWRDRLTELDYALDNNLDFQHNRFHDTDPDYNWGFKVDVGYLFPCSSNDLRLEYAYYGHSESDNISSSRILPSLSDEWPANGSVTSPSIVITAGGTPIVTVPGATLSIPPDGSLLFPTFASAKSTTRLDSLDLDFGHYINFGCRFNTRFYGGLRFAHIENKFDVLYRASFSSGTFITEPPTEITFTSLTLDLTENISQTSRFNGLGPLLGVDYSYNLGRGFNIIGNLATSVIVGRTRSSLNEHFNNRSTATLSSITIGALTVDLDPDILFINEVDSFENFKLDSQYRVVPNIDAKLALGYTFAICRPCRTEFNVELGYLTSYYFNPTDRLSEVNADQPMLRTRHSIDASFDGPYVKFQVRV